MSAAASLHRGVVSLAALKTRVQLAVSLGQRSPEFLGDPGLGFDFGFLHEPHLHVDQLVDP